MTTSCSAVQASSVTVTSWTFLRTPYSAGRGDKFFRELGLLPRPVFFSVTIVPLRVLSQSTLDDGD
ncbi:MAG: hypothetical protein SFW36_24215 [Leptolyngbyaceae cyanobacterium bins.59]|nr:hypothetical protein [Leptolyngbyaceae cyanobacterium bins.59]